MIKALSLPGFDPLAFVRKTDAREPSLALMRAGGWTIIAWGPSQTIAGSSLRDLHRLERAGAPTRRRAHRLPFVGGLLGWIGYDVAMQAMGMTSRHAAERGLPQCLAHRYDNALLWDGVRVFAVGDRGFRRHAQEIHARPMPRTDVAPCTWHATMKEAEYRRAVRAVRHAIRKGDVYQLNLTYALHARSEMPVRHQAASLLAHHQAALCASFIEYRDTAVLSVSPESFLHIDGRSVVTSPIKGTRPRGRTPAEDLRLRDDLLRDAKESSELAMIVDLLRNDLGMVCRPGSIRVREHRVTMATPSVWHTVSHIEGRLAPGMMPMTALRMMMPGGSVTGCPKRAAIRLIDHHERTARGLYCGVAFSASIDGTLRSSILIRTIVRQGRSLSLGVGGGIVWDSVPAREWRETLHKARGIVNVPCTAVWIDGVPLGVRRRPRALDPSDARTHGVFETMRAVDGKIACEAMHLDRLLRSCRRMKLSPPPRVLLRRFLRQAVRSSKGLLRVKLVWDGQRVIIETAPLICDPAEEHGIRAVTVRCDRRMPAAKALPYHREWHARSQAWRKGAHEALLVNRHGVVTEGATSSLLWVRGTLLCAVAEGMLAGTMRSRVLALARSMGWAVRCTNVSIQELLQADEVFITRATTGVTPVTSIDGRKIASGTVGPRTRKLMAMLSEGIRPRRAGDTAAPRQRGKA